MPVRIRFSRVGKRNAVIFRIVAIDRRKARDAAPLEILGFYDPRKKHHNLKLENMKYWLKNGAKISGPVISFLKRFKYWNTIFPPKSIAYEN